MSEFNIFSGGTAFGIIVAAAVIMRWPSIVFLKRE